MNGINLKHTFDNRTCTAIGLMLLCSISLSCIGDYNVVWKADVGGYIWGAPLLDDDRLYLSIREGAVVCLDAGSGQELWRTETGEWLSTCPTVGNGGVLVGTRKGSVIILNDESGGEEARLSFGDIITTEIVLNDNRILFGVYHKKSADGELVALDANSLKTIWKYSPGRKITSNPEIKDGRIYFGSWDGRAHSIDLSTGEPIWVTGRGDIIFGKTPYHEGSIYLQRDDDHLYRLNAETGEMIWKKESCYTYTPVIRGETIFYTCSDGRLCARDIREGDLLWEFRYDNSIDRKPVPMDGTLIIADLKGNLVAVAEGGELRWCYRAGGVVTGAPAVGDGLIYAATDSGKVYCLKPAQLR